MIVRFWFRLRLYFIQNSTPMACNIDIADTLKRGYHSLLHSLPRINTTRAGNNIHATSNHYYLLDQLKYNVSTTIV